MVRTKPLPEDAPAEADVQRPSLRDTRRWSGLGEVVRLLRTARAARERSRQEIHSGHGVPAPRTLSTPKIVVVIDDEPFQVELTTLILESCGHRVTGSTIASQVVPLVIREAADVVVVDFMMRGATGADVCRELRAEPRTRGIRIVLLSGTPESEIRRSCTQYDVYLSKPADHASLSEAVGAS